MQARQELNQVVVGMEVYDSGGEKVGTIKGSRLGEGTIKTTKTDTAVILHTISEALGKPKNLSSTLSARLFEEGFIHIKRGRLRGDVLTFPRHVDSVNGNTVRLKVKQSELIKI